MSITVSVTEEDIQRGRQRQPRGCPVGLALQRSGVAYCCVAGPAVIVRSADRSVRALLLPEAVQRWLREFDAHRAVDPIDFELGLPVQALCGCAPAEGAIHLDCPRLKGPSRNHAIQPRMDPERHG